jgi:membrane protease YdiL (CAAX protease family)
MLDRLAEPRGRRDADMDGDGGGHRRDHEPPAGREQPDGPEAGIGRFVRLALYFYGAMLAAALVWRMGLYRESVLFASSAAEAAGIQPARDAGIGLAVGLAVVLGSHAATRRTGWGERLARGLGEAIGPVSIPDALLLAMASGLGEEMFFRGALQPRVGLLWASLLFGAVHFVPRRAMWPWTVFAMVIGGLFGALFEWTGNLVAPVVAHTVVNAINLPVLARRYANGSTTAG